MSTHAPRYDHLMAMTDEIGLFEHALFTRPRPEHGYCVDDVARGLLVLCRAEVADVGPWAGDLGQVAWRYLRFLLEAQAPDGRIVNRRDVHGVWHGMAGVADCWGRALWGLGAAVSRGGDSELTQRAMVGFEVSARMRSPWMHAMVFAGLGAAEVLRVDFGHVGARALLADAVAVVGRPGADRAWPWPRPRLTYANATVPELFLAAGYYLVDDSLLDIGLSLLEWLLDVETAQDHLSVTPVGGWAQGEARPGFDQQPIEVSCLADACARAFELTGEPRWAEAVELAAAWFLGANDAGVPLADERSGGCRDGLEAHGRNENQGAESTLALLSTLQQARRLQPVR